MIASVLTYGLLQLVYAETFTEIGLCSGGVFRLGIPHLHMMQEILRIMDKLNHMFKNTNTGLLDKQPLTYSFIKACMGTSFLDLLTDCTNILTTNSLIKSTWHFLLEQHILLQHDIYHTHLKRNMIKYSCRSS
jgi:hypothetical protein